MRKIFNGILKNFSEKRHFYIPTENGKGLPLSSKKSLDKDDNVEIKPENLEKGEFSLPTYIVLEEYEAQGGQTGKAIKEDFFEKCMALLNRLAKKSPKKPSKRPRFAQTLKLSHSHNNRPQVPTF